MRILIIEDDKELCSLICFALNRAGYETDSCHTGSDGLFYAKNQIYDAIILDRMLPELDGLTVLESLRRYKIQTPVILATALELMARIRAVTRRPGNLKISSGLTAFGLHLEPDSHLLEYQEASLTLSKKESALLEYFMKNPGQTLPRSMLLSYVWGVSSDIEEGNLDNYVYFLRRRFKALKAPVKLTTVHGVGYRMEEVIELL